MDKMDKELTVPKWVPNIPQMLYNLSAQFICPSPKILDFNEKRLHWASIVRGSVDLPKELVFVLNSSTFNSSKITLDIKSSG